MWLEENEGAADGNPNFPMEIIGGGLPVRLLCRFSQNLSIYGFPKLVELGYRRGKEGNGGLSSPASVVVFITCTLVSGKYGFTTGNELQDSRSGWFSYSSDVQVQNFSHSSL
ncbi:hypothetical protein L3X38_024259 [Prunus dulcis]|uniref:Uncharacterized protein n=1 Tax=Prunus dulcis TaxID=3755 RepID=A0AAD4W203_PRUDU|nr:hypothetical protein L3X38_024259 [Prunus dulcis]